MSEVKNIIFDLGGIFLNLNFGLTKEAFVRFGVKDFDSFYTQHHANTLFEDLERGFISTEQFYYRFRAETNTDLTNEQIEEGWNAMLLYFSPERIAWLEEISQRYRVFLFSNTNQIHYEAIHKLYARDLGRTDFNDHFIKAYYSHEMGLRKPYHDSFEHIINEQQLVASETLFIDDTIKNIQGAQEVGLQTIHLVHPQTVLDLPF